MPEHLWLHVQLITFNYGSNGKNEKLIDELLRNKNDSIAFQVSKSSAENYWKTKLNISSILMFDSHENFKAVSRNITWVSDVRKRSKNLVFIRNATISDIVGIENEFSIDSTSFLLNDDGKSIELVASYMFTPRACRSSRLTTINRFFMDKMSWESSKIFPRKYRNMYNCKLIAGDSTSGSGSFDGWNIIKTLSKIYNFKVELKIFNTTAWRSIKAPQIADVDLIMKIDSHAGFVQSVTFHTMGFSFAHPQGELYTQVEKMYIMFDCETWVAIIVTFVVSLVVIKVVNLLSKTIQHFIFGRLIQTPTMNLI